VTEAIFPSLAMIIVGCVGLYFVRENFRNARESGSIYISKVRFERRNGEGWFRAAYWINWVVAAIFGTMTIGGVVLGAMLIFAFGPGNLK
jgi:hypothetical protein